MHVLDVNFEEFNLLKMYNKYLIKSFSTGRIDNRMNNQDGNIQKIIIDSWDSKYDNLLFGDYDVSRINSFEQLYSIIKSGKDIHLNINKSGMDLNYQVTMPVSVLNNYTRLTIKIFSRSDLDAYLPIDQLKF